MGTEDSENDAAVIVSRGDLEAVANGEKDPDEVYTERPQWGRRAALAAIGGTGALAFLGGRTSAQTSASGTVGPADEGIFLQISGDIVAEGTAVTDLLNVQVYASEADIPDTLDSNVVALHG